MKYPGKQAVQIIEAPHLGGSLGRSISPLLSSMERFEESHPRVKLTLNSGTSEVIRRGIERGRVQDSEAAGNRSDPTELHCVP